MPFFVNAPDALYSFQFDLVRLVFTVANIGFIFKVLQNNPYFCRRNKAIQL